MVTWLQGKGIELLYGKNSFIVIECEYYHIFASLFSVHFHKVVLSKIYIFWFCLTKNN